MKITKVSEVQNQNGVFECVSTFEEIGTTKTGRVRIRIKNQGLDSNTFDRIVESIEEKVVSFERFLKEKRAFCRFGKILSTEE